MYIFLRCKYIILIFPYLGNLNLKQNLCERYGQYFTQLWKLIIWKWCLMTTKHSDTYARHITILLLCRNLLGYIRKNNIYYWTIRNKHKSNWERSILGGVIMYGFMVELALRADSLPIFSLPEIRIYFTHMLSMYNIILTIMNLSKL